MGVEKPDLVFPINFRWSPGITAWKELLLLIEGQTFNLLAPKSHYARDIAIDNDTCIVATEKSKITGNNLES